MNPTTGLFQNILAAATGAADALQFKNAFIDRIYWDIRPIADTVAQTITIVIPNVNEGAVVDIGAGPIQPVDYAYGTKTITLDKNLSSSYVIKAWDQIRTPIQLREKFFQPAFEALKRAINRRVIAMLNTTNFSTSTTPPGYTLFTGTGTVANQITRADITTAWTLLAGAGVDVDDTANVSLMVNHQSFGQFLADPQFTQALYTGDEAAIQAQQRARLAPMLGVPPYWDQMFGAFNAGHAPAALMHRYAIGGVSVSPPALNVPGGFETEFRIGRVPVQIQVWPSGMDQGWVVHLHVMVGLAPLRPDMIVLFQSAS